MFVKQQSRFSYIEKESLDLVLSLLAELVVGGLVHELLKLIGVGKLQLHKPSLLHRRLVHNRGSLSEVLNISILIIDIDNDIKSSSQK